MIIYGNVNCDSFFRINIALAKLESITTFKGLNIWIFIILEYHSGRQF